MASTQLEIIPVYSVQYVVLFGYRVCGGKVRLVQYKRARQEETWPAPTLHQQHQYHSNAHQVV
jgi:hypothetical protein